MAESKVLDNKVKTPTKQRKPSVGRNGVPTPPGFEAHPERRHNGAWKKEETARWKFEQWIKKTEDELADFLENKNLASFDESTVNLILQIQKMTRLLQSMVASLEKEPDIEKRVKLSQSCTNQLETIMVITEKMTNQIYGQPKQTVEQTNIEAPKPLSPRKQKKEQK